MRFARLKRCRNKYKQRAEKENKTITWGDWGKETVT